MDECFWVSRNVLFLWDKLAEENFFEVQEKCLNDNNFLVFDQRIEKFCKVVLMTLLANL
jgi:hypothetical protein